jgi:glucose-1-phosphate cytidylyltransferase
MKAMILAGGRGTRIAEESSIRPKPMIEIGGMPILWHIMKIYETHGINDFIVCLGYRGDIIKHFFANYRLFSSDMSIDVKSGGIVFHRNKTEDWRVTLVETGENTETGGRIKIASRYLDKKDDTFLLTYGDGVGNIDIRKAIKFHQSEGRLATVTAVQPPGRFGALDIKGNKVTQFLEKPKGDGGYINGGFFVLSRKCVDYISGDNIKWENQPLEKIAKDGQLSAYRHDGFWQPMDTLRDKGYLENLWQGGRAPWKTWKS